MKIAEVFQKFEMVAGRKLAITTERSYRTWIEQFMRFMATPEARAIEQSEDKIEVFLSRMAREDYSSVSQNQAFNAILFLYRHVIKTELQGINALRCRRGPRERYTPTPEEVLAVLHELQNTPTYNIRLAGALMYACGMRVSEVCEVRIKDFDLTRMILTIWEAKGGKDRRVRIPEILLPAVRRQLARATALARMDAEARQPVQLPGRMDKAAPARQFDPEWFFMFPSVHPCAHPRTKKIVRWCISPDVLQRAVKAAAKRAGVTSRLTPHCFRHGFCEHLLEAGESIKRVGEAMGHADIRTTAGYGRKEHEAMKSPLDRIIPLPRKSA